MSTDSKEADRIGQQCWSCSKRRVKCDSTLPVYLRCGKDKIECPGYQKPLVWMGQGVRSRKPNNKCKAKNVPKTTQSAPKEISKLSPAILSESDMTTEVVVEVMQYCNACVIPESAPAKAPFRLVTYDPGVYIAVPRLIQQLLIVTFRTLQIGKNGSDPVCNREVCHYRGEALRGLYDLMATVDTASSDLAVSAAIMTFIADFGLSQGQAWHYHANAIRRIIQRRGGFTVCLQQSPTMRQLLLVFLVLDTLSASFCETLPVDSLTVEMQAEYSKLLPGLQPELLGNTDICPTVLMQLIIRVTAFRVRDWSSPLAWLEATDILSAVEDFDSNKWAREAANSGLERPIRTELVASERTVNAWTSLAQCHKLATLLYLFNPAPGGAGAGDQTRISGASRALQEQLHVLFAKAETSPDAPVEGQFWKLLYWPLLMFVTTAATAGASFADVQKCLSRLQMISRATGNRQWLVIAIRQAARYRAQHEKTVLFSTIPEAVGLVM